MYNQRPHNGVVLVGNADTNGAIEIPRQWLAACAAATLILMVLTPSDAAAKRAMRPASESAKKEQTVKVPPGVLQLVVSIRKQHVSLFSNGALVTQSPVSTGTGSHPTPTGVFSVVQKQRYHRSNLYGDAPMPYMQRVTWSGVALHEGKLPGFAASHGCIRLPTHFAQFLWGTTKVGVRVIITQDDVTPVEIAHPGLFKPTREVPAAEQMALAPMLATVSDAKVVGIAEFSAASQMHNAADAAEARDFAQAAIPAMNLPKWFDLPMLDAPVRVKDATNVGPQRSGPISIFISRKEGKVFVRQEMEAVFDAPVTIREPERPIGTHVFTAVETLRDGADMRWTVVSMPTEAPAKPEKIAAEGKKPMHDAQPATPDRSAQTPNAALDRVVMPKDAVARISELLSTGASLIISDFGLGETGQGTEFAILTR